MCGKLLGIEHSNHRNSELWTKNVFNSTFPVALANYLWENGYKVKYITTNANFDVVVDEITVEDLFNCKGLKPKDLYFSFEDVYAPYEKLLEGGFGESKEARRSKKIDLVVKRFDSLCKAEEFDCLQPLEIKMTVVPDNSTKRTPDNPGSELVIRPTTTLYAALGLLSKCNPQQFADIAHGLSKVNNLMEKDDGWKNNKILMQNTPEMKDAVAKICQKFHKKQMPLLLQPIWRTNGIDHELDKEHAIDLIAWSNFAYIKLFLTKVPNGQTSDDTARRAARCLSKFIQYLYQSSSKTDRKIGLESIKIPGGNQNDREISVNGVGTRDFVNAPLKSQKKKSNDTYKAPRFPRKILHSIILDDGQKELKPERRFDQSIYIMDRTGLYNSKGF